MNFPNPNSRLRVIMKNLKRSQMKNAFSIAILLCGLCIVSVSAQIAAPPPAPSYQPLSPDQLDQALAPIALYPDPLISEILPAATFPTEIVMADRYISGGGDPNAVDQQPWDPSVQALAHYPTVLQWLDDNLPWTTEVGEAFVNQQQDVMDSIQRLRTQAYNLGNLQSTPQQQVVNDGGDIEILPADDNSVYLPDYQPDAIYYQTGYPITFGAPFPIGVWLYCDFDWHNRHLVFWDRDHPRPHGWWHEPPDHRRAYVASHATVWHPANRPFAPATGGDRGWNNRPNTVHPTPERRTFTPAPPGRVEHPGPVVHPTPAPAIHGGSVAAQRPQGSPVEHYGVSRPTSTGAYIGIQSSHETQTYSDRGRQSMQTVTHSEPVSRPAPAPVSHSAPSGGGGGAHGGGGGGRR